MLNAQLQYCMNNNIALSSTLNYSMFKIDVQTSKKFVYFSKELCKELVTSVC